MRWLDLLRRSDIDPCATAGLGHQNPGPWCSVIYAESAVTAQSSGDRPASTACSIAKPVMSLPLRACMPKMILAFRFDWQIAQRLAGAGTCRSWFPYPEVPQPTEYSSSTGTVTWPMPVPADRCGWSQECCTRTRRRINEPHPHSRFTVAAGDVLTSDGCEIKPVKTIASGWTPAWLVDGQPAAWFYSRGC